MKRKIIAFLPLAFILLCIFLFYFFEGVHFFNFDTLEQEHLRLNTYVKNHPFLSVIYFIAIYTVSVVLVLPDSIFLTLLAGFLFPFPLAVLYCCLSETLGALIFYSAIKLSVKETLAEEKKRWWEKKSWWETMRLKAEHNQTCYLLFLRFSHILPFWLINTAAAVLHCRTFTFIWTTFVGTLPLILFLADAGGSLSKYFAIHNHLHLSEIFSTRLKLALVGMGCCALLPILYKKFKKN
jgi:uncharacterized membrane protein YdjX (TVP38/TMEM64 family)